MPIEALLALLLADAASILTALYWGGLIVGGGLLLVSVLGGSEHDAGTDVDAGGGFDVDHAHADVDVGGLDADAGLDAGAAGHFDHAGADVAHAGHAGMSALSTWFSMRFVVFFLASFGVVGVILRHLTGLGTWTTFAAAFVAGAALGQGVHQLFRYLRRTSGDSAPRPQDYVFKLARVTIAITPPNKGEIALQVRGVERFVPAVSVNAGHRFASGDEAVVVGYRAGVAQVVTQAEFERLRSNS